jgi:CBS domain-containing protein
MTRQESVDRPAENPRPNRRAPRGQSVRDIMTSKPEALEATATVMHAAELMRERNIGDVVVLEDDRLYGILTDRDIVVRVLAERGDPAAITVGEICSRDLTTISPTASLGTAVRLIREKAIRRLPVVEDDGMVVGIVSLGDLAAARDRKSALGDISAAPSNT